MKNLYSKKTLYFLFFTKSKLCYLCVIFFLFVPWFVSAQTTLVAELTGNPVDTSGWNSSNIDIEGEEIVLTQALQTQAGAIFYGQPYNLNECINWKVEFDYRLYNGSSADGLAFWYLENPPTGFGNGQALGMPLDGRGLKICIDTFDNDSGLTLNPELQIYYGEGYSEKQSEYPNLVLRQDDSSLRSQNYQHCIITWNSGFVSVEVDGNLILSGTPVAYDGVEDIVQGYFGFSASTGAETDRQSIKNVQVFVDSVVLDASTAQIEECDTDGDGFAQFDLTSVGSELISTAADFSFYHSADDAANEENKIPSNYVTSYINDVQGQDETIYVKVSNGIACPAYAEIDLHLKTVPVNTSVIHLEACDDDNNGTESYNLTNTLSDFVNTPTDYQISYYKSQIAAINENAAEVIPTPDSYSVAVGENNTAYIKFYDAAQDCYRITRVIMETYEAPQVMDVSDLLKCTTASPSYVFDLTQNTSLVLGSQNAADYTVTYYETQADADVPQNEIGNPSAYQSQNSQQTIYVRIESNDNPECYDTSSFMIESYQNETVAIEDNLIECLEGASAVFDLTEAAGTLQLEQNNQQVVGYYLSETAAANNTNVIENPSAYNSASDSETVYIKVENGGEASCYTLYALELETQNCTIDVPKGFSPNGDGINDTFVIPNLYEAFSNFNLKVYSRYGLKVYEGNSGKLPWDGNSENGGELPTGTYFYVLNLHDTDFKVMEGWVYLNR